MKKKKRGEEGRDGRQQIKKEKGKSMLNTLQYLHEKKERIESFIYPK